MTLHAGLVEDHGLDIRIERSTATAEIEPETVCRMYAYHCARTFDSEDLGVDSS